MNQLRNRSRLLELPRDLAIAAQHTQLQGVRPVCCRRAKGDGFSEVGAEQEPVEGQRPSPFPKEAHSRACQLLELVVYMCYVYLFVFVVV